MTGGIGEVPLKVQSHDYTLGNTPFEFCSDWHSNSIVTMSMSPSRILQMKFIYIYIYIQFMTFSLAGSSFTVLRSVDHQSLLGFVGHATRTTNPCALLFSTSTFFFWLPQKRKGCSSVSVGPTPHPGIQLEPPRWMGNPDFFQWIQQIPHHLFKMHAGFTDVYCFTQNIPKCSMEVMLMQCGRWWFCLLAFEFQHVSSVLWIFFRIGKYVKS